MLLGCIGDDFTGSSDLGLILAKEGMRTVQYCGVPESDAAPDVEAGVVALKSRTCPPSTAVEQSLAALDWLRRQGCRQYILKYCSTFDSTPEGNIGPVIDALMEALQTDRAIVCPAFPATGRRVFHGHLFVGDRLLNESGMQDHPLTPMTDPDIRRWLALQTRRSVGHVPRDVVADGTSSLRAALDREVEAGRPVVVVDAISDPDLRAIGHACADTTLITGGSGIGMGLPANFSARDRLAGDGASWKGCAGSGIVLAGSCSRATRAQVAHYAATHPSIAIDATEVIEGRRTAEDTAAWLLRHRDDHPMAYSTTTPENVDAAQARYGRQAAAAAIETFFATVATHLVAGGVARLVVAGGETSGAITSALGIETLRIGPEIAPGVPALRADGRELAVAFKSGNFGDAAFLETAMAVLGGET